MITWSDEGTILTTRPFGEGGAIVDVFTEGHGRHTGVVRGGSGRRLSPTVQPGAQVAVTWKARLDEHLGAFTVEPVRSRAAQAMGDRLSLQGLNAVVALLTEGLPERDAHPALYARTVALLDLMGQGDLWPLAYLQWELAFLEEMGFALDLTVCAATGTADDLAYVSPRTGRALSRAGAGDWAPRLLPLPPVLRGAGEATGAAIAEGLAVTGHFLLHRLLAQGAPDRALPAARTRLVALIAAQG
jgi:DNA repair protein RecO (recombination protein O)